MTLVLPFPNVLQPHSLSRTKLEPTAKNLPFRVREKYTPSELCNGFGMKRCKDVVDRIVIV